MADFTLPESVEVSDPAPDVTELARRFRAFDALHHDLEICVPATGVDFDAVVEALAIERTSEVLDVACGHGGLLWRMARHTGNATGIDLSPWALTRAADVLADRRVTAQLVLGDASRLAAEPRWDRIACIGASWVFHGPAGTWRALRRRLRHGGRIAVGDLRPRAGQPVPGIPTASTIEQLIAELGGHVVAEIVSADDAWDAYGRSVLVAAERHRSDHPDDPAADQRAVARAWVADATQDRERLEFATVVAHFPAP